MSNPLIDLTTIHHRLEPRATLPALTCMEELRRREREDRRMTLLFGALGMGAGAVVWMVVWWITRP